MAKNNGDSTILDIPVKFSGVSIGQATARIGIGFDRSACSLKKADDTFCGHRLTGRLVLGGKDESPGQKKAFDKEHFLDGVFDVKRLGINATNVTTGLTFSLSDIDIKQLGKFAKGTGRLLVNEVAELPDDAPEHDEDDGKRLPGSLKSEGPWRDFPLADVLGDQPALLKALRKADLTTMGELADYTAADKRLIDIEGIGPGKAAKIEEATMAFFADNPDAGVEQDA